MLQWGACSCEHIWISRKSFSACGGTDVAAAVSSTFGQETACFFVELLAFEINVASAS